MVAPHGKPVAMLPSDSGNLCTDVRVGQVLGSSGKRHCLLGVKMCITHWMGHNAGRRRITLANDVMAVTQMSTASASLHSGSSLASSRASRLQCNADVCVISREDPASPSPSGLQAGRIPRLEAQLLNSGTPRGAVISAEKTNIRTRLPDHLHW